MADKTLLDKTTEFTDYSADVLRMYAIKDPAGVPEEGYVELQKMYNALKALIDANAALIATNISDIGDNASDISTNSGNITTNTGNISDHETRITALEDTNVLLQEISHRSAPTSDITNTSSSTYVSAGMLVAITPKSATSKLVIRAVAPFSWPSGSQRGIKLKIQKNIDSAGWTDIEYGDETYTGFVRTSVAGEHAFMPSLETELDSPGITEEIEFRLAFTSFIDGSTTRCEKAPGMHYITVREIEQ